jgi:hypothetical protein
MRPRIAFGRIQIGTQQALKVRFNRALDRTRATLQPRQQKRREDARALPKLSRNERGASTDFARSALGVRCVLASLSSLKHQCSQTHVRDFRLPLLSKLGVIAAGSVHGRKSLQRQLWIAQS